MTADDIISGKGGFQKADLMDYGSLYGMGSYFGQDYTAFALSRLANLTENRIATAQFGKAFDTLAVGEQASVRDTMRHQLQGIDLTKAEVRLPNTLGEAIGALRAELADGLGKVDLATGWTPAYSQVSPFMASSVFGKGDSNGFPSATKRPGGNPGLHASMGT